MLESAQLIPNMGVDQWQLRSGSKIGHDHIWAGKNCQDACQMGVGSQACWGIVCDGCGSGSHSEVGAKLICNAINREIARLNNKGLPPLLLLDHLFCNIVRFVEMNVYLTCPSDDDGAISSYIAEYWLATILGFIIHCDETYIFRAGDGVIAIDEQETEFDQNNCPTYLSYAAVPNPAMASLEDQYIPKSFNVEKVPFGYNKIMVATDGFCTFSDNKGIAHGDIINQQWNKKGVTGLQRWMNVQHKNGHFRDDCAIVVAERVSTND